MSVSAKMHFELDAASLPPAGRERACQIARSGLEIHEGRLQIGRWAANVRSRLKLTDAPGRASSAMPFFQPYWGKLTVGMKGGSPIRASILPDLSGHERAYFAVMHNAASTPFSVLV